MTEQTPPGDEQAAKRTAARRTAAHRTAASRRTEEHDAAARRTRELPTGDSLHEDEYTAEVIPEDSDAYARFRPPPPGKPTLLPEEPPRTLDDTPVAGSVPDEWAYAVEDGPPAREQDREQARGNALSWDDELLLLAAKRTIMGASFALPLVIVFGLYALVVALAGDGDSAPAASQVTPPPGSATLIAPAPENSPLPDAEWPGGIVYAPHTVPALIKDEIAAPGAQMGYSFSGEAGTAWAITVESRDDVFDPQVTLYAPSGSMLATNDNRAAGVAAADLLVTLPETGVYRVLVESSTAVPSTGPYLLALFER